MNQPDPIPGLDRIPILEARTTAAAKVCADYRDAIEAALSGGGELNSGPALIGLLDKLSQALATEDA